VLGGIREICRTPLRPYVVTEGIEMTEMLWIRSHIERLLQDEWDVCRVEPDADGDYPFRYGTAGCWVRLLDSDPSMIRVAAHAVVGVRRTAKLLTELNDIQRRALSSAVLWSHDGVVVSQTLSPIGLTAPVLAQAMAAVGGLADEIGVLLASMFGGETPFEVEVSESEDVG
jgi:hypothetical protein